MKNINVYESQIITGFTRPIDPESERTRILKPHFGHLWTMNFGKWAATWFPTAHPFAVPRPPFALKSPGWHGVSG